MSHEKPEQPKEGREERPPARRPARRSSRRPSEPSRDIAPVLDGWEYEPGSINVRKITGLDGREKLQMRLDLGLLQMELDGRPDGRRPFGRESLLEYYEERLRAHRSEHGGAHDFELDAEECEQLREEAVMYYHRYLSLFILGDFAGVVRDTARNIRLLDLCAKHAADDRDKLILEQYRPYITMMNTRAAASIQFRDGQYKEALGTVTGGLESIREFFTRFGQDSAFDKSSEVKILKRFARDIRKKMPSDPLERLNVKLQKAIRREDYEEAARLRDEIKARQHQGHA